jgi:protein-S-isoprenylcysteine O-methyltransferase Ste14
MTSSTDQDSPAIKIPPPVIFFILLILAGLAEYWSGFFRITYLRSLIWLIAVLIWIFAGYLALHAVVVLKRGRTPIDPGRPTIKIVVGGPFRISRNPMYLSLVLLMLGMSVAFLSIWFLIATIVLMVTLDRMAVAPEEAYLEAKFGDAYRTYQSNVRRWF